MAAPCKGICILYKAETIPLTMGLQNAEVYPQIVFVIILSSVIITTVALTKAKSHMPKDPNASDAEKQD